MTDGEVFLSFSPVMAEGRICEVSKMGDTTVLATGKEFKQLARNKLDDEKSVKWYPGH